jgi:hypothetical protein
MLTMTPPNNRVEATRKTARLTRAVRMKEMNGKTTTDTPCAHSSVSPPTK